MPDAQAGVVAWLFPGQGSQTVGMVMADSTRAGAPAASSALCSASAFMTVASMPM